MGKALCMLVHSQYEAQAAEQTPLPAHLHLSEGGASRQRSLQ